MSQIADRAAAPRAPDLASGGAAPGSAATAPRRLADVVRLLPKAVLTILVLLAIADMVVGVFLRYVMVPITDYFNLPTINFFWVEEVGEYSLAWMTLIGAGIGLAERAHFTLRVVTHHLPLAAQRVIHVVNHALIVVFGALTAWYGTDLAITNLALISPGLQLSLAWLYASASVGGGLIVLYGIGTAFSEFADVGKEPAEEPAAIAAAGD